jgi:hypothetical protein
VWRASFRSGQKVWRASFRSGQKVWDKLLKLTIEEKCHLVSRHVPLDVLYMCCFHDKNTAFSIKKFAKNCMCPLPSLLYMYAFIPLFYWYEHIFIDIYTHNFYNHRLKKK